jgi:hypothetical protein
VPRQDTTLTQLIRAAEAAEEAYAVDANARTLADWVDAWDRVGQRLEPVFDAPEVRVLAQRVAVAHLHAYRYLGDVEHSEAAASLFERLCADGADDDIAFAATADLATLRFQQYLDQGDTRLLTASVEAHEEVLRRCPPDHPHRPVMAGNLANALVELSRRDTGSGALDRAIELHEWAVHQAGVDGAAYRPALLVNLATALVARYQRDGSTADLDRAAALHREAQRLGEVDEQVAQAWADLQWERYSRSGEMAELNDVIATLRHIVSDLPEGSPSWCTATADLANAVLEHESRCAAREGALDIIEALLADMPPAAPGWAHAQRVHGMALWREYQRTGDLARLDAAIRSWQAVLEALPGTDAERPAALNGVAAGLQQRAAHFRDPAEADRAVRIAREALAACPAGAPDRAITWNTLGHALLVRYRLTKSGADLNEAVEAWRACLAATSREAAVWPSHAASLGNGLRERAAALSASRRETDLREAAQLHRAAAEALEGTLELPGQLVNLGMSLHGLAAEVKDPAAYLAALHAFRRAAGLAQVTSPPQALDAALAWHRLAVDGVPDWPEAAEAAEAALAALRALLPAQLSRSDKEAWLLTSVGMAAAAARAHCAAGQLPAAVVAMESGRGMLLNEVLPPDDRLRVQRAELYRRYQQAAAVFAERSASPSLAIRPGPL